FQADDGVRDGHVTGVQPCALPISPCPAAMPPTHAHPFAFLNANAREALTLSRRNLLKAGLAGVAGLTLPGLLRARVGGRPGSARSEERRVGKGCRGGGWSAPLRRT